MLVKHVPIFDYSAGQGIQINSKGDCLIVTDSGSSWSIPKDYADIILAAINEPKELRPGAIFLSPPTADKPTEDLVKALALEFSADDIVRLREKGVI